MKKLMKCTICKKPYNTKKSNYGWHISKKGHVEKCSFPVMPMQMVTKPVKIPKLINYLPKQEGV